jgi:hypothetical protein
VGSEVAGSFLSILPHQIWSIERENATVMIARLRRQVIPKILAA